MVGWVEPQGGDTRQPKIIYRQKCYLHRRTAPTSVVYLSREIVHRFAKRTSTTLLRGRFELAKLLGSCVMREPQNNYTSSCCALLAVRR